MYVYAALSFIKICCIACYHKCASLCCMWIFSACLLSCGDVIRHAFLGFTKSTDLFYHVVRPFQQAKHASGFGGSSLAQAYLPFPVSCFKLRLDRRAGAALPVGSLHAAQMNKVLLFVIKWLLVIRLVLVLLGPPCVQPQLLSAKLITFQSHK